MLTRFFHKLEHKLHARDFDQRVVRPFEWGLEYLGHDGEVDHPLEFIKQFNAAALSDSDRFFTPPPSQAADFELKAEDDFFRLTFPSGMITPYEMNNLVHARLFAAQIPIGAKGDAVIVLPQWNANEGSHVALCRGLNRFGVSALRLSLPYHDRRMPEELKRADYMVSANIGRTIQAIRQSVFDLRRAADWLLMQGYRRVGVVGTSVGSCVSWLAFIHDARLQAGVFNMVSSWFGDVVWRAVTTSHIRQTLETALTAEELREAWLTISPSAHTHKLAEVRRPTLLISAIYDLSFLPDLSQIFFDDCDRHGVPNHKKLLPCGHYTIGRTPFKYLDAWHIINFFRRLWR